MWFLAWREIRHNRIRFGLILALVGLLAFLVFVLTGLAVGLGEASVSGLRKLPADVVVVQQGAQRSLDRSDVLLADAQRLRAVPGVTSVEPLGYSMATFTRAGGDTLTVSLLGGRPGAPFVSQALSSSATQRSVVLDGSLRDVGVRVGDPLRVQPGGQQLRVAAFANLGSLRHATVAFTSLATWQALRPSVAAGADENAARASAFLVRVRPGVTPRAIPALAAAVPGSEAVRKAAAVWAVPGYAEETGTIGLIRGFLLVGAALLVGSVFWILTLQKEGPLAVLRATGARQRLLLGSYLAQVAVAVGGGIAVGLLAVFAAAGLMPARAFVLRPEDLGAAVVLLAALSVVGAAASLRRLLTVDPLLSLGRTA